MFFRSRQFGALLFAAVVLWNTRFLFADENLFLTVSSLQARSAAMAGACTAVLGGPGSALLNPASLSISQSGDGSLWMVYLNPIGIYAVAKYQEKLHPSHRINGVSWLWMLGMGVKSIVYQRSSLTVAMILTEQLPNNPFAGPSRNHFFASEGLLGWTYSILAARLRLADQIAIGGSGYVINTKNILGKSHNIGGSYGILIRPHRRLAIGVAYIDVPNEVAGIFESLQRTVDETINIGITYRPIDPLLLAFDLRNVTEESQQIKREPHFGVETTITDLIALRAGYYRQLIEQCDVFSMGIGLIDNHLFNRNDKETHVPDFIVNYGLQLENTAGKHKICHFLTILLRI